LQSVFEEIQSLHTQAASLLPKAVVAPVDIYISHNLNGIYAGNSSTDGAVFVVFPPPRPTTPLNPLLNLPNSKSRRNASNPLLRSRVVFPFRRRRHKYHANAASAIAAPRSRKYKFASVLYVFSWSVVSGVFSSFVVGEGMGVFVSPVVLAVVLVRIVAVPIEVDPFRDADDPLGNAESDERDLVLTRGESVTTVPGTDVVLLDELDECVDVSEVDVGRVLLRVGLGDAVVVVDNEEVEDEDMTVKGSSTA
jgi:hypothetical protein